MKPAARFAGLVGLTALQARSAELPVNFLSPREPKPVKDPNKRLFAGIAAAALVLIVGGLVYGRYVVSEKAARVLALQNEKSDLEEDVKNLDDVGKRYTVVKDWENKGVNWLDELYDLTVNFPDPATTEVVTLNADPLVAGEKKNPSKKVGIITMDIRTKSPDEVDDC